MNHSEPHYFQRMVEDVIQEYPAIFKRRTPTKDVSYRIRVLKVLREGIFEKRLDVREFVVNDRRAVLTPNGVYFNKEELELFMKTLNEVYKTHFSKNG